MHVEHFANCHGEWNAALAFIGSVPLAVLWLKVKIQSLKSRASK